MKLKCAIKKQFFNVLQFIVLKNHKVIKVTVFKILNHLRPFGHSSLCTRFRKNK